MENFTDFHGSVEPLVKPGSDRLFALIVTGRGAGLKDAASLQSRESACQSIPDPFGDVLRGRVAQAIDLDQLIMIQVAVH